MAESTPTAAQAAKQSPKPPAKAPPKKTPKTSSTKLDLATLGGIAIALLGILGGLLLEKGSIQDIAQATAAMIVLGGTFGAVLVTNPLSVVIRAFGGLRGILLEQTVSAEMAIE